MNAIVIIGPPGVGKSTVALRLMNRLSVPLISSGDIARRIAQQDAYARGQLDQGGYAPEGAIRMEVRHQIESALVTHGGFIIEGFPRKLEQLVMLEQLPGVEPRYFLIDAPPMICLRRLVGRARKDDHPDSIAERMRHYQTHTTEMNAVLFDELVVVDGNRPSADIVAEISEYWKR